MQIKSFSGINFRYKYQNINRVYPYFSHNNDIFIRTPSFSSDKKLKDTKSFNSLQKWVEETSFLERIQDVIDKTGEILGSGFEGTIYGIPSNTNWVLKKYDRGNLIAVKNDSAKLIHIEDPSPGLNIGQTIARAEIPAGGNYSYVYYILKRQTGKSIGVPLFSAELMTETNIQKHLDTLKKLANAPQKTYNKCINDILYVTNQGYEFDCCNPYNFMFDKEKQEINFVDINDKKTDNNIPFGDVLYALLDGKFAINFQNADIDPLIKKEANDLSQEVIKKFFKAMTNLSVKFTEGKYFNILLDSNIMDNILKSTTREDKIKELIRLGLM